MSVTLQKNFSTAVRELSISFEQEDGNEIPTEYFPIAIGIGACRVYHRFDV
jgi:hypothetical protein